MTARPWCISRTGLRGCSVQRTSCSRSSRVRSSDSALIIFSLCWASLLRRFLSTGSASLELSSLLPPGGDSLPSGSPWAAP
eukprot:3937114-Rhodomonas_salina.1